MVRKDAESISSEVSWTSPLSDGNVPYHLRRRLFYFRKTHIATKK